MRKRNTITKKWGIPTLEEEAVVLFGDNQKNLSDVPEGTKIELQFAALITSHDIDTDEHGELLVLKETNGEYWATISPTFVDTFVTMADWLESRGKKLTAVKVSAAMSKKGRKFLNCELGGYE